MTFAPRSSERAGVPTTVVKDWVQRLLSLCSMIELDGEQHIEISEGAKPFAQTVPCQVPVPHLRKVEAEQDKMVNLDVIEPVDTPTNWCAPLVVVPKPNGQVRL